MIMVLRLLATRHEHVYIFWFCEMNLHSVLTLDPGGNMGSPCQRTHKRSKNIVPLDPRSASKGTGFLLKSERSCARWDANSQENQGDHAQQTRRHLWHKWSQNLGRRVFILPVGVFSHIQSEGSFGRWGESGWSAANLGNRNESRAGGDDQGKNNKTKLGHFD